MQKPMKKQEAELRPIYLRMSPELVAWLDREARRQRRSRAFIVAQACRMLRAVWAELEEESET